MQLVPVARNAIVVANAFNPSVIRESFLQSTGVLSSGAVLGPGFVFSDQVVGVPTAQFNLVVVPQQLQVTPASREGAREIVRGVIVPIVSALPHTPYTAAGVNFVWHIQTDDDTVARSTRRLFAGHASSLGDVFDVPDARFGFFASKDLGNVRLKIDVKPVQVLLGPEQSAREVIQCAYNFHMDLSVGVAVDMVDSMCVRWNEFDQLAEEFSNRIRRGLQP